MFIDFSRTQAALREEGHVGDRTGVYEFWKEDMALLAEGGPPSSRTL
jgi:hypothetical protein